jgi:Immunity protein Imm1
MTYKIAYDISYEKVVDAEQAEGVLERLAAMYGPGGYRCVLHVASGSSDDPWLDAVMRVGIDFDLDRSFVSWLGERVEYGYQPDVDLLDRDLIFDDDPDGPPLEVPPAHTRVTAAMAMRVVREYVSTGRRPSCLPWLFDTAGAGSPDEATDGRRHLDSLAYRRPTTETGSGQASAA